MKALLEKIKSLLNVKGFFEKLIIEKVVRRAVTGAMTAIGAYLTSPEVVTWIQNIIDKAKPVLDAIDYHPTPEKLKVAALTAAAAGVAALLNLLKVKFNINIPYVL